jgi:hypothetical protein
MVDVIYDLTQCALGAAMDGTYEKFWFIDKEKLNDDSRWNNPNYEDDRGCHQCTGYDLEALRSSIDNMDRKKGKKFLEMVLNLVPKDVAKKVETLAARKNDPDFYKAWQINAGK